MDTIEIPNFQTNELNKLKGLEIASGSKIDRFLCSERSTAIRFLSFNSLNKTENPSVLRCLARLISLYELPRNSTILSKLTLIKTILTMAPYQKVLWITPNQKLLLMPSTKRILWITRTIYLMNDPQPNFDYGPKRFFINGP